MIGEQMFLAEFLLRKTGEVLSESERSFLEEAIHSKNPMHLGTPEGMSSFKEMLLSMFPSLAEFIGQQGQADKASSK
jgi:hypothetical protein